MNNEEFRKLLKSSVSTKNELKRGNSTKEIAREVVEQEFRERSRKRGRDEDYLSDDDDDDDGGDGDGEKRFDEQKPANRKGNRAVGDEKSFNVKDQKKPKYRDRAKERREGKHQDSSVSVGHLDDEMTKYLGGDEEHTHLVKGLDKALAEKVRRDELKQHIKHDEGEIDLDKIMEETVTARKEQTSRPTNTLKAHNLTNLSSGMLSYINRLENIKNESQCLQYEGKKKCQGAQFLVRTTFYFSLDANTSQRSKSWETPKEKTLSVSEYDRICEKPCLSSCTPIDSKLLKKIKAVYSSLQKNIHSSNEKKSTEFKHQQKNSNNVDEEIDLESDDDIFGDIGDYIPPTTKADS